RISLSEAFPAAAGTARILSRPFGAKGADGAREARLQMVRCRDTAEAMGDELAQSALDAHAALAFGAEIDVAVEIALLDGSEGAVFLRRLLLLLPPLRLVLARAHLGRLRAAADVAVLPGVLEQRALEHLPAAVQTGHHRAHRAVEDLGDLLVREAFDVRQEHD